MNYDKHIVLLTPGFARDEQDTTCTTFLQDYVLAMKKLHPNYLIDIIAIQYPYDRTNYQWNGVDVYSARGKLSKYLSRLVTWAKVLIKLSALNRKLKIDVIHAFWLTEATFVAQLFQFFKKTKVIAYTIGQDSIPQNRYLKFISSRIMIVGMSEQIKNNLNRLNITCDKIIPLGINSSKLAKPESQRTIDIIGIGSLIPLKNYSLFIEIVSELKKIFSTIKAVIIGNGEEYAILQKKINELNLEDNITLKGQLSHTEVFEQLAKSKILLHTSSFEGQSTVMMEALAMGTNIICFDVGRMNHSEKIVACTTKEEMTERLKDCLQTGQLTFEPIIYSMDNTVNEFVKLYVS